VALSIGQHAPLLSGHPPRKPPIPRRHLSPHRLTPALILFDDSRQAFSRRIVCARGLFTRRHKAKATKHCLPRKEGSGAPKGALSNQCPRQARPRAAVLAARRLSALTLAALATGFYPDGSAPEPGFPRF
jgi:hypothetical protein